MTAVSVVLCGYNQAEFLSEAVDSVLNQTQGDLELIVVDNGSTDGSSELLSKYGADPRVRLLLHQDNGAVTARLNEAIKLSRGEYISFLYADDYYLPTKLERQLECFEGLPLDYGVVYSPGYRHNIITSQRWLDSTLSESGDVLRAMLVKFYAGYPINPISPLIRKSCLLRYPFHEDVMIEGEGLFLRLALSYRFQFLDEPVVVMREHLSNNGKAIKKNVSTILILLEKLGREKDFPPELQPMLSRCRAIFSRNCGWLAIRMAEDPAWARACFRQALAWQPLLIFHARTLAGVSLSIFPVGIIRIFNRMLNIMRPPKENVVMKKDYA